MDQDKRNMVPTPAKPAPTASANQKLGLHMLHAPPDRKYTVQKRRPDLKEIEMPNSKT